MRCAVSVAVWFLVACAVVACSKADVVRGYGPWTRAATRVVVVPGGGFHDGIDFRGVDGDPVLAADDGVVAAQIDAPHGVGTCVLVEHHCFGCDPTIFFTLYCHLERSLVTSGQPVARGQQIAELGHSGPYSNGNPHLHFAMYRIPCAAGCPQSEALTVSFDPMQFGLACFDPDRTYKEMSRPILTRPIVCTGR
jgi:murein DD-endopeptidase MepM/ murein hydrolase activator NlpD